MERNKFVPHELTGLPIRIPPYLRREIARGDEAAGLQLRLIARSRVIGERTPNDTLATNFEENVRLRGVARFVSKRLTEEAIRLEAPRYFTFVHGSVARGLVRSTQSGDPSDVDIDLVVDGVDVSCAERTSVRQKMQCLSSDFGVKLDVNVYNLAGLKKDGACCARRMLEGCSYPLANMGGLFEEARSCGLETLRFFELDRRNRRRVRAFVDLSERGDMVAALNVLDDDVTGPARAYLGRDNDGSFEGLFLRAAFLKSFLL